MKAKTTRVRKIGRVKKVVSEWEAFWEDKQGFLGKPVIWHDAIPEVLHIAIALQQNEPQTILEDLFKIRDHIRNLASIEWNGSLSVLFQIIRQTPQLLDEIHNTVLDDSIRCLTITYNKFFGIQVPKGNLMAHKIVYKGYFEIKERRKPTSILCKYILSKFLYRNQEDPFGFYKERTQEEILEPVFASSVTPTWIIISQDYKVVNHQFSEFVWNYNIKYLPFIAELDSVIAKREKKNFKTNKMNLLKNKMDALFAQFKKSEVMNCFDRYVAEVFMGFVSRMHYLALKIVEQEERHEGEIAEATLRILYETRLKFLWMNSKQDVEIIKQFREYKVGREKLFLDYLQEKGKEHPDFDSAFEKMKAMFSQYMQSEGVDDYKLTVEKGDAFEKNIQEMATDLGESEVSMYFIIYKRTSDIIHGNWRIIENYHLQRSLNPAQDNLLTYNSGQNTYAGLLPSFLGLMLATSALIIFFEFNEPLIKNNKRMYNSLKRFYAELNKKYQKVFGYNSSNTSKTK